MTTDQNRVLADAKTCKGMTDNGMRRSATPCMNPAGPSGFCAIHSPEGIAKRRAATEAKEAARVEAARVKFAKDRAIRAILTAALAGDPVEEHAATLRALATPDELTAHIRAIRIL